MTEVQAEPVASSFADASALSPFVARSHRELAASGRRYSTAPGTLLFSDISGFTALNERLVRRGREGTELMVAVLDLVFGSLLNVAHDLGGDLLEFGGDALLIRFSGSDHLRRAATAARRMQQAFAANQPAVRRIQRVRLGISMGLETGTITLLSCGGDSRQLVVAGEALAVTLGAEGAAEAGQVVVGPTAASLLGASVRPGTDGWSLLVDDEEPTATSVAPVDLRDRHFDLDLDVTGLLSAPLAEHLRSRDFAGEHRRVAPLFLRFAVDPDAWQEDDGALFEIMNPLAVIVERACTTHGGTLINVDVASHGGKFVIVAGAPRSLGDNVDRALAIAIDVIAGANTAGLPVTLSAGVNEGVVFWGSVGSASMRAVAVIGDTVNTAARVMAAAPAGTVLCEEGAFNSARVAFDAHLVEPFAAKGKRELVRAVAVGTAREWAAEAGGGHDVAFIGREAEVAAVLERFDEVQAGASRVAEIVGPAGIGKSRLVEQLVSNMHPATSLRITGGWYGRGTAFRALADGLAGLLDERSEPALRELVERAAPHLLQWLPLLGLPFGIEVTSTPEVDQLDPRYRADRLQIVLAELLDRSCPRPLVITVEDAHWLDGATASVMEHVAESHLDSTLVLVARREEASGWVPDVADEHIPLAPLDGEVARRLATEASGATIDPHRLGQLVDRAAGHPLFLLALIEGASNDDTLPDSVEDALRVDLDTYPADTRRALGLAAVLGAEAEFSLLQEVMGDTGSGLIDLLRRAPGFAVIDAAVVRFTHALRRSVAYEALPFRERRAAHSRAAAVLGSRPDPPPELLSLHHFEAREFAAAWEWSCVAADRARAALSPLNEIVFLERAARSAQHARSVTRDERMAVYERWGDDLEVICRYGEAQNVYRRGALLCESDRDRARLYGKVGRQFAQTGELNRGLRWCRRAERLVEADGPAARIGPAREHGALLFRRGDLDGALAQYSRAESLAARAGDARQRAEALRQIGTIEELRGRSGIRALSRAIATLERVGEGYRAASAALNLGAAYYDRGDWDRAIEAYEVCAEGAGPLGDLILVASVENNISEIRSDRGELDVARLGFESAYQTWQSCQYPLGIGVALGNLGRLDRRSGDLDAAGERLAAAAALFVDIGADDLLDEVELRFAELELARGAADAAADHLARVRVSDDAPGPLLAAWHRTAAICALHRDDRATFDVELDQAGTIARDRALRYERVLADEIRCLAEDAPTRALVSRVGRGVRRLQIACTGQQQLMPFHPSP